MKGSGVSFYRFPADMSRKALWVAALNRKDWQPTSILGCVQNILSAGRRVMIHYPLTLFLVYSLIHPAQKEGRKPMTYLFMIEGNELVRREY